MPEIIICEGCDDAFNGDEAAALSSDWVKIDDDYFCPECKGDLEDTDV